MGALQRPAREWIETVAGLVSTRDRQSTFFYSLRTVKYLSTQGVEAYVTIIKIGLC